jgi:hypothetical protein
MKVYGDWRYGSTIIDLGIRYRWIVSFTPRQFYPKGNSPSAPWTAGWIDLRCGEETTLVFAPLWSDIYTELHQVASYITLNDRWCKFVLHILVLIDVVTLMVFCENYKA